MHREVAVFDEELVIEYKKQTDEYNNWNKNMTRRNHSRLNDTGEWISELEERVVEITDSKQEKKKNFLNVDSVWNLWENKNTNISILGVSKGEVRGKGGWENIWRHHSWKLP